MDLEEQGVADLLMDDNATAQAPRPGTSLVHSSDGGGAGMGGASQAVRPVSSSGRPLTGFARPGTNSGRAGAGVSVADAFRQTRQGTARPVTSLGRQVRLGTASMLSREGGPFINVERLDLRKYAARPAIAKALCDYLLYHDHNPKAALELAAEATVRCEYKDWWWKARLGKCYYQLGLYREAERQFKSALKQQSMVASFLELAKVYLRLDQPQAALEWYQKATEPVETFNCGTL